MATREGGPAKAAPQSLAAFAASRRATSGPKCWACGIKEAPEIAAAVNAGDVTLSAIRAWLVEQKGYSPEVATRSRIQNHVREHVSPKKAS